MSNELGDFLGGDTSSLPSATAVQGLRAASLDRDAGNSFVESLDGREWLKFVARQQRWTFGKQNEVLGDDRIAVHPGSFKQGWACWDDNVNKGEVMVSISDPMPLPDDLPSWKNEGKLSKQYQVDLQVLEGEHLGVPLRFRSNSYGGVSAVQDLMGKLADRLDVESEFVVPVVTLEADEYDHEKWGKMANPVFKIVDWANMEGTLQSEAKATPAVENNSEDAPWEEETDESGDAPPARRRRVAG